MNLRFNTSGRCPLLILVASFLIQPGSLLALDSTGQKPNGLTCDSLTNPLGDDTKQPSFSWKLQDSGRGAEQTAYEIMVSSTLEGLLNGRADVWDSGRVLSGRSLNVQYGGPALSPETRYYWRVKAWNKDAVAYPPSDANWWETGLFSASAWRGKWIGYEDSAHQSIRNAGAVWITNPEVKNYNEDAETRHDFRLAFDVNKPIKTATLYATGEDTTAAWINGKQVLAAIAQPGWGRLPWRTYTHKDITAEIQSGRNQLSIEITLYKGKRRSITPMSSILYLEMTDGTVQVFKTGTPNWKAALNAVAGWFQPAYDDGSWAPAVPFPSTQDAFGNQEGLGNPWPTPPVAVLRHEFHVADRVVSARLYATAMGAYKFSINGKVVGDQVLSPGWTDFRERATYQAFDVTSLLRSGKNAIGAYLAPGWYATPLEWIGQGNNYGATPPAVKGQLRVVYADGRIEWVATDETWKADNSPITFAEIYDGETYDARRQQAGWDTAAFSDASWHPVQVVQPHEPELVWQSFQPIRKAETLPAKSVTNPSPGTYVYDFGQNLAGFVRLQAAAETGTTVRLRFAELVNPDGSIYVDNLRNAKATDNYTFAGQGTETYEPTFTFHGFRYVEITGLKAAPSLADVKAVVLHTDAPNTAQLETGSSMVNQLWKNIQWGQRSNFVGVPTDCPQRDERLGWSADAQVFWRTASFNMDLAAFSRKYAADLRGTQRGTTMYGIYAPGTSKENPGYGAGWSDAGVIVPWSSWIQSGDTKIVEENWSGMTAYLEGIEKANPDHLWKNAGIAFGDWLAPEGTTSEDLIATAYWAYDVSLMQQMAHASGRASEERRYAELFAHIKTAFNQAFVRPDGSVAAVQPAAEGAKAPDNPAVVETQTGYVLALHMDLLPESLRTLAAAKLAQRISANQGLLGTGFLGTPYLLGVLTDTGHADLAYQVLLNKQYPSWGYMIDHGATTMWERWNGDKMLGDPGMNSFNHYAYGAVAEWIYRYASGIDTVASDAGFHSIYLHPHFDERLGKIDFTYESPYGPIRSAWTALNGKAEWTVTIPPNTKAHLLLSKAEAESYAIEGRAIATSPLVEVSDGPQARQAYEVKAGTYHFSVRINQPR